MSSRVIPVLILSFLLLNAKGQDKPVYECIYRFTMPRMPSNMADQLSLTANAVIDYKIITNGDWYLIYGKAVSIAVENTDIRIDSADGQEDSALIRKPDKFYNLSLKTVQPLIVHQLFPEIISTASAGEKQAFIQKSDDSSTFLLSSKYPPILTPFPNYNGNKYGVVEIRNARFNCTLVSEKQIDFDFHRYDATIKFQFLSKPLGFPF